jgi:prepilin peptidase CpaA
MNLIFLAPLWLVVVLACTLAAAAVEDAARYRISNIFPIAVIAGAIGTAAIYGPSWSLWQNALVFLALLALGTVAFAARLLGGGDVKLFAAIGLWLDLRSATGLVALVFIAGGVVAVVYLAARFFRGRGSNAGGTGGKGGTRVPYGVAIALGALALMVLDPRYSKPSLQSLAPIKIVPHRA